MIGPGFRSATRLAATPASMMLDVLYTNPVYIREALARLKTELESIDELLSDGNSEALEALLISARDKKERLS
jgi:prephenate dehydrogenase